MNYLEEVKAKVRLEEGEQVLEKILAAIYLQPGISTKVLARKSLLPVPVVAAIKKELIKAGLCSKRYGISLTPEGRKFVEYTLGFQGIDTEGYQCIISMDSPLEDVFQEELATLSALFDERPQVDVTLDQSKCTPETSLKRALLCLQKQALIGKEVLCVGDDDLVSISIGFVLRRLFPDMEWTTQVHVVDIDTRFLDYIEQTAGRYSFPIQCHHADLRQPLPDLLQRRFDCFFTDPPYTLPGVNLFLSRGIEGLKQKAGCPIFLSFAHKSPEFAVEMQRGFVEMGLAVTEVTPAFNVYEGAEMIGNSSQMIVLQTTLHTTPFVRETFDDLLYTGELKRTIRVYQCKHCQSRFQVGAKGDYNTIEELKTRGCPHCRKTTFNLIDRTTL